MKSIFVVFSIAWCVSEPVWAAIDRPIYLMPMNCAELVPDTAPFLGFFESLGRGMAATQKTIAKRVFRILALREKLASDTGRVGEGNPIDPLIRKFICYYREQKDPLSPIAYDDAEFVKFVSKELDTLETRVNDAMFQVAFEDQQRQEYERRIQAQRAVIDSLQDEAEREAIVLYNKATSRARSKVKLP